jgi:hypothetical protein
VLSFFAKDLWKTLAAVVGYIQVLLEKPVTILVGPRFGR